MLLTKSERAERLSEYAHTLIKNKHSKPKKINPLFCRAERSYLLMSLSALLCVERVRLLGFNKLNGDWSFDPLTVSISRLAIPKTYREVAENRGSESYPISPTLNGVDGISQGLYLATFELVDTKEVRNYPFYCIDSKCSIIDLQNSSEFEVYEINPNFL